MHKSIGKEVAVAKGPGDVLLVTVKRGTIRHSDAAIVVRAPKKPRRDRLSSDAALVRCICCGGPAHVTGAH